MGEHSTTSQASALRREARRRKILENSTNRLRLIEGVNPSLEKSFPDSYMKPEQLPGFKESVDLVEKEEASDRPLPPGVHSKWRELVKENKELKDISDFFLRDGKLNEEEDKEEGERVVRGEQKAERGYLTVFVDKRLHYIMLAVIVNVLFFFNFGFLFYENIFFPFYTVKIMEFISRRDGKNNFQPFLCLFVAGLPSSVQKLMKIFLTVISALISDLFLYIFSFVIGTKIINIPV